MSVFYDEIRSLAYAKEGEWETGYRYDLLNRQSHVKLPDGCEQENLYDGEGLRAGLTENGKNITFLFYNGEILAECNGDSMPIRRHLTGQGLSHVQNLKNNTFHAYHQDEQGSTAYVTGITGETENLYSYDGFGNLLESREDITNRILYTGQQYDQETGQYYLRARYYNPVIGRFTQEDTYRGDGLNLYAYCDNNPVLYYDPSGHQDAQQGGCKVPGEGDEHGETLTNQIDKGVSDTDSIIVTEDVIRDAMQDAPLQTQQSKVSQPVIQNYIDRIVAGETDIPPIKVDGNIIIDGNHRYIASRITNVPVDTIPWSGGNPNKVISWTDVFVDTVDWGNR